MADFSPGRRKGGSWDADVDRLDREDIFWGRCIVGFVEVVSTVAHDVDTCVGSR